MTHSLAENEFLTRINDVIEQNISDENFGVSELANAIGMSRSNLLRKVKQLTKLSASQYIRQIRLKKSMVLLRQKSLNVSEVSYQVGFGSTSYFIKCFREYYGYPPGEVGRRNEPVNPAETTSPKSRRKNSWLIAIGSGMALTVILFIFFQTKPTKQLPEKSIAVLPFKNDSNDSTNLYLINGLMEATLNNLQKINDLRVISRTSVEKYRNTTMTIPEIAKELGVSYIIEGSGQKVDNQILLNIQLIETSNDQHLWGQEYQRELKDIFELQREVARKIASQIQIAITPEELVQIDKTPTENLVAYDLYLQGIDLMRKQGKENLEKAILLFRLATEEDEKFAGSYSAMASSYYLLDLFQANKRYSDTINILADQALLLDDRYDGSLIAKALYYMNIGEDQKAIPYLEKALKYNPNSPSVLNLLSDFYANRIPDKNKYLEYALKGIRLNVTDQDSSTASFLYLNVSNALIQSGFTKEAERYINKSLDYNPNNIFSQYVKAYILYTRELDIDLLQSRLIQAYKQDTTRLDALQEVAKICYTRKDFEQAKYYYDKFLKIKATAGLDVFGGEDIKIAYVMSQVGKEVLAQELATNYKNYVDNNPSIYSQLGLCAYHAFMGNRSKAIESLRRFAEEEKDYYFWIIFFLKDDPIMQTISNHPDYDEIIHTLETKFWKEHHQIRKSLEEMGLI